MRDILNITGRRFPYAEVIIFPSLVQGDGAASQLCEGVKYFNRTKRADVIIIGRGGGSIEDLWAFNDETLAMTIAASDIPVISAVGHETDFTIADFAADRRAPTPSAAAELAVPDTAVLKRQIGNIVGYIEQNLDGRIRRARERLSGLESRRCLSGPEFITEDRRMKLMLYENRLDSAVKNEIGDRREEFVRLTASLRALDPMAVISRGYSAYFHLTEALLKALHSLKKEIPSHLKRPTARLTGSLPICEDRSNEVYIADLLLCRICRVTEINSGASEQQDLYCRFTALPDLSCSRKSVFLCSAMKNNFVK